MLKKKSAKAKKKPATKKNPTILAKIAANTREIRKIEEKLKRSGEKLFKQAIRHVFKKFPDLQQFEWKQYTPGWNDGDPCTFGCYFESLQINGEETESVYELEQILSLLSGDVETKRAELEKELSATKKESWEFSSIQSRLKNLDLDPDEVAKKYLVRKTLTDLLEAFDESVFESMFGEGTVIVTREETTVTDCEHD